MLKFALALGISYEWLFGPGVWSAQSLAYATMRTVCAMLLAWMILESVRALFLGAMSLDDTRPAPRKGGTR
jgi:hypothetical protein